MKTIVPASTRRTSRGRKGSSSLQQEYDNWLKADEKFRKMMEGQAIDHRPASVVVREGRR